MASTVVVTARIGEQLSADLDRLAAESERSRAWLVGKAVEQYVADELEMIAFIEEGDADFREGRVLSQEEMTVWAQSLSRPIADAA